MSPIEKKEPDTIIYSIISACFEVSNVLSGGFMEKVYERALFEELSIRGIPVQTQASLQVEYKGKSVGQYFCDMLVYGKLVVELKCVGCIADEHIAQTINYLKATGLHLAIIVNFQNPKLEWRKVYRDY